MRLNSTLQKNDDTTKVLKLAALIVWDIIIVGLAFTFYMALA